MKWKFWEDDDAGLDDPFAGLDDSESDFSGQDFSAPESGDSGSAPDLSGQFDPPQQEPRFSPPPSQQAPAQQQPQASDGGRDLHMELVLSKLDAIKGQLDNLSARVERLERRPDEQEQAKRRGPWYAQQ